MFEWLKKKLSRGAPSSGYISIPGERTTSVEFDEPAPPEENARIPPVGQWVLMEMSWELKECFVGYIYFDRDAGLSAKGGPESAPDLAEMPNYTVRLPMPLPFRVLTQEEVRRRGLPSVPSWLKHFGPQPDAQAPWRTDPALSDSFHPSFPDDLQVAVHDGEPRRTSKQPEYCWVRVVGAEKAPPRRLVFDPATTTAAEFEAKYRRNGLVYVATLLNAPLALETVRAGDTVRFLSGGGLSKPLQVTPQYLDERRNWEIAPCNTCGMGECLDPPSVMARFRFPDQPPQAVVQMFSAFCAQCGGLQMLNYSPGNR